MLQNAAIVDKNWQTFNEHRQYNQEIANNSGTAAVAVQHSADLTSLGLSALTLAAVGLLGWFITRNLLAQLGGTDALVAFYRAMDAGGRLGSELRDHFGLTPAAFVQRWRSVLSHLPS